VYRYATGVRCDFDANAMAQLRMAHELYNEFVAIWRRHEEQKAAAWREHPEVDALTIAVEVLDEQLTDAVELWRKSKSKARNRTGDKELKAALDALRAELKEARSTLKKTKTDVHETLIPRFRELGDEAHAAGKATYADLVQTRGLYWATYNLVREQHLRAVQALNRKRTAGQPAELRFRRWQAQGQLAVQLQREATAPQRTPELLASGEGKWRNVISLPPMQERKHRSPLTIRTGVNEDGETTHLTVPEVIWHRPIPPEADITAATVSRQRIAGNHMLWAGLTAKIPVSDPSTAPGVCGVDTGWRTMPDGSIRVAIWRSKYNGDIVVPSHLHDSIRLDGEGGEVSIPPRYISKWLHIAELQSRRDRKMDRLREQLKGSPEVAEHLQEGERIDQWRSPNRFAALAFKMRESKSSTATLLEQWRKADRRLWEWQTHERLHVIDWRTDLYRVVAALLCGQNSIIAVEEPYVAKVTRKTENNSITDDATRKAFVIAAPSSLILCIKQAGVARGVSVTVHPAKHTTMMHKACGYLNEPGIGVRSSLIRCAGCEEIYDQDANAAWWLVDHASAELAPSI